MTATVALATMDFRVPDDLAERDQRVLWWYEERSGSITKVPYQVGRRHASSIEPGPWACFDDEICVITGRSRSWVYRMVHKTREAFMSAGFQPEIRFIQANAPRN